MNPIKRLRDAIFGAPAALRNKPGGMAMIHGLTTQEGGSDLNGRIVTTIKADARAFWSVEPTQLFVLGSYRKAVSGRLCVPGETVELKSISDACLRPIKNPGDDARTEERTFQPPVPTREKETA